MLLLSTKANLNKIQSSKVVTDEDSSTVQIILKSLATDTTNQAGVLTVKDIKKPNRILRQQWFQEDTFAR